MSSGLVMELFKDKTADNNLLNNRLLLHLATVNQRLLQEVTERTQMEAALQEANRSLQEVGIRAAQPGYHPAQ